MKKKDKNSIVFSGKAANSYDSWFEMPSGAFALDLEHSLLLALCPDWQEKRVLDIGCGTGNQLLLFRKQGIDLGVGIDISEKMLGIARGKFREGDAKNLFIVKASGERLPFKAKKFDRMTSVTALEFFKNLRLSIQEMLALNADDYLIAVLNRWSLSSQWRRFKSYFAKNVFRSARFYSPFSLKKFFREGGFSAEDYRMIWKTTLHFFPVYFRFLEPVLKQLDNALTALGSPFGAFLVLKIARKSAAKEEK